MKCVYVLVKGEGRAQEDHIAVIGYIQCNDRLRIDSCGFFTAYRSICDLCEFDFVHSQHFHDVSLLKPDSFRSPPFEDTGRFVD